MRFREESGNDTRKKMSSLGGPKSSKRKGDGAGASAGAARERRVRAAVTWAGQLRGPLVRRKKRGGKGLGRPATLG